MITQCRSCRTNNLTPIISLGNQYLSDFRDDDTKPPQYPIDVVVCEKCSLLQLGETTPPGEMYHARYGYRSGINQTMRDHLRGIVKSAEKLVTLSPDDVVLDIGSNDATLLKNYGSNLKRVGFDPVEKFGEYYNENNLLLISEYFNAPAYLHLIKRKAKIITVISCFYDMENPSLFVQGLKDILDEGGIIIIQQNYLASMLEQNALDNICHEHLEFYSLASMEHLFARHGLEIFKVEENDLNGGSFRTYIRHIAGSPLEESVSKMREKEKRLKLAEVATYKEFAQRMENIKGKILEFVDKQVQDKRKIYLYGASTRVGTLLQYLGLDKKTIVAAVERNPEKWGKIMSSTGIPIISEEQARKERPDFFIVGPWFFKKEFLKREEEYLKTGGLLLFPLPSVTIVSKDGEKAV